MTQPITALVAATYRFFYPHWDYVQAQSLGLFRTYLNDMGQNPIIRMWADATPGSGHQSSTVAILRQLTGPVAQSGFGYAGTIELYYAPDNGNLAKLQRALPELNGGLHGQVNGATVQLIAYNRHAPAPATVNLGFTGGADRPAVAGANFASQVGARYFLRLQPYLWTYPEELQFLDPNRPDILLTDQAAVGGRSFQQRAYYIRTPIPAPNWALYNGTPARHQAAILDYLTGAQAPGALLPVYSIRTTDDMQVLPPAADRLFEVIAAALASQRDAQGGPIANAQSIVVLVCDEFTNLAHISMVTTLLNGGLSAWERVYEQALRYGINKDGSLVTARQRLIYQLAGANAAKRAAWLNQQSAPGRVHLLWNPTLAPVMAEAAWLAGANDRVLLVNVGRMPEPLFHWAMASAGWPPVFEGQNSATVALNIGRLYFHMARTAGRKMQYPTSVLSYGRAWDPTASYVQMLTTLPSAPYRIQEAADNLVVPLHEWDSNDINNPAEGAGGLVRDFRAEPATGALHRYLQSVRTFYQNENNDKLRVGASFMFYILRGANLAARRAADGAPPPLRELLTALEANTSAGTVHIAPGAFTAGGIFDFYTGLSPQAGLVVSDATITTRQDDDELVAITVTGSTHLVGVPTSARIEFTAPEGIVVADARYRYDGRYAPDEIPWLGFSAPFIDFYTADEGAPPAGAIGGTIDGLDLELVFRLPVAEGKWQLTGNFSAPYPSIARFYQLAGGVDLVRSLPSPFNGLAGFGLRYVQLVYDVESSAVETVSLEFGTSEGFALLGGIRVENIEACVTVQQPADLTARRTDWTVAGTFTLGSRQDAPLIAVSASGPRLVLTGGLAAGVLRISDVITAFAPGVTLTLPGEPDITGFACSFTPATGDYSVSCDLNLGWPVRVGGDQIFAIDSISFGVSRLSSTLDPFVAGHVTIGEGEHAVVLELTARYTKISGWTFAVAQSPDTAIRLDALFNRFLPAAWRIEQEYGITELNLTVVERSGFFELSGRTVESWRVPFLPALSVDASLRLGYGDPATGAAGWRGRLETAWHWNGIDIVVYYDYDPMVRRYGIVWGLLEGVLQGPGEGGDWTAVLRFTRDTTLGGIVETMVRWATGSSFTLEAPWDALNTVPLSGLALVYTFNDTDPSREGVAFTVDIGPIELGFARIDKVGVSYNSRATTRVAITLFGSFPWNVGDGAVGDTSRLGPWDASRPGNAPAPPGTGGKYLDVRLLALGQRVTVPGLAEATSVGQAIELMRTLPDNEGDRVPAVVFDPRSDWLIGADLGVLRYGEGDAAGYLVSAQVVFNDPRMYGLRLALAGEAAKVLRGLDFEILYRQVSETVGVYEVEITLPDSMRRLGIGAYTLTLPVLGIAVYTNGDFQVDVGFPWNNDFSRSFTVEGIVYPGIPVTGSAGFYFGKLSGATTDLVPTISNGTFNPVLTFGIGMRVGFGKSLEYGALRAGFSLTAVGIVEGVLAAFNAYQPSGERDPAQLQDSYYFRLRGTFGVVGRLYGSVDFAVVKAEIDVAFSVLVEVAYESYVSLSISVVVAVDVAVSILINLGLFEIKMSFSFSIRVKETFTLDNQGTPPWIVAAPARRHWLSGPADRRLGHRRTPSPGLPAAAADPDRWLRLLPSPAGLVPLTGWLAPAITIAHDERDTTADPARQLPCQVLLTTIETVPATDGTLADVLAQAGPDTSFEALAKMVLRWAIATGQPQAVTPEQVDALVVRAADLRYLLDTVLVSTDEQPMPITPADIDTFMSRQFQFTLRVSDGAAGTVSATAFPMPPGLRLTVPAYGPSYPGSDYVFGEYNSVDATAIARLRQYFDQLAVQVDHVTATDSPPDSSAGPISMAGWVQSDYFLMLARQMVQAALDSLRDYKYVIDGTSADQIAAKMNTVGQLTGDDRITGSGLLMVNRDHPLEPGLVLALAPTHLVGPGESLEQIARSLEGLATVASVATPTALALVNAGGEHILRPGASIDYQGTVYTVNPGDSLLTVARRLGVRITELLSGASALLSDPGLLRVGATLHLPLVTAQADDVACFASVASAPAYLGRFSSADLARQNAACPVLRIGELVRYLNEPAYRVRANDTLADIAVHFGVSLVEFVSGSGVLTQRRLLSDLAVLTLPPFTTTGRPGDTLTTVAARFATTVGALAMTPLNTANPGLFATRGPNGELMAWLDVPHLAQYQVAAIIEEAQRTLALRHLSRMAARYSLHGTRLPTAGITPNARGMWVQGTPPTATLPPFAGLYGLTGQQIEVPSISPQYGPFMVFVRRTSGAPWLSFAPDPSMLRVVINPQSSDAARLSGIASLGTSGPFDPGLTALAADPMVQRRPVSFPLGTTIGWQSPVPIRLPYGPAPDPDQVPVLRIMMLPEALTALAGPRTAPRFALRAAAYDEATGATSMRPVSSYGWATVVRFTVKRVPAVAGRPATDTTYEVVGAGGSDVVLLERIVDRIGAGEVAFRLLTLAYPADPATSSAAGLETDPPATVTFGLAQVNLSTQTRPTAVAESAGLRAMAAGPLNSPAAFVRLLWEASITRGGGYYLYYHRAEGVPGLPERLFDDRGEARLSLVVIYERPSVEADENRIHNHLNAAVIADGSAGAVVIAEADPAEPPVTATPELTLAGLAARTYSDVGDLASANRGVRLRQGASVTVKGAVFQAPPGGISLSAIVAQFGLPSVAALNAANPRWSGGLPDPLRFPSAVWLPSLTLTAGVSPYAVSLDSIATYYGVSLGALAAANAEVPGLFAVGSPISVPGGPYLHAATVPPGAAAVVARRARPAPVPPEPVGDFAKLFLLNTFSLLGYQVAGNAYFRASNLGLPAGPTPPPVDTDPSPSKVRVAPTSDVWEYRQSFSYPSLAEASHTELTALPPADGSPYRGLGALLQVSFSWLDYYGNTIVSTLDRPAAEGDGPRNQPPIVTGYSDAVLGLAQWPSVAASWRVSASPQLEITLTFDPSRYRGLIRATAIDPRAIRAVFTDDLDPVSAGQVTNYHLDGGVGISAVSLGADRRTVTVITDRPLAAEPYTLTVADLRGTGDNPPLYQGTATFPMPDRADGHSSTVTQAAGRDLAVYSALYYQLTDVNGVAATISAALLIRPVDLDATQWAALREWLFDGPAPVYGFLADRASGAATAASPAPHTIAVPIVTSELNPNQIFTLSVAFTVRRTGGMVLPGLATADPVRSATTVVAPLTAPLDSTGPTVGLRRFAQDFEAAMAVPGQYRFKVAVGVDRTAAPSERDTATIWAVRLSDGSAAGIGYTIANPGRPALFAPRPLSNRLQARRGVPIFDYATGRGLSPTPTRRLEFADVDLDVWGRILLTAVDDVLTPEYTAAIQIVARRFGVDFLSNLLSQKELLARAVSRWMIALYAGETADAGAVQDAFYQQLLVRLSRAYEISAAIQFDVTVNASIDEPTAQHPPRLSGPVVNRRSESERRSDVTITSPKLPLRQGAATLPFLLTAPETVNAQGLVLGAIDLDLTWSPDVIEHQIAEPRGIAGYLASSWLSFVLPDEGDRLTRSLGAFPVPLVLRAFPTNPTMTGQTARAQHPGSTDLGELKRWIYSFTWSLPVHYVQDRVHGLVHFNVAAPASAAAPADSFDPLAQFVTVYPSVRRDLEGILGRVDATTTDEQMLLEAAIAVDSFTKLLERVSLASAGPAGLSISDQPDARLGQTDLSYAFEIIESGVEVPNPLDPSVSVTALVVTIVGAVPAGVGTPIVLVDPEHYDPVLQLAEGAPPSAADAELRYRYVNRDTGEYLTQADGQTIAARTMVLPGLDVLERQDAWAGIHVTRNQQILPDRPPMAEPFVYTTPVVRFADPLLPSVDSAAAIDIALVGPGGPVRPLTTQFRSLFMALFAGVPAGVDRVTVQLEARYSYRVNPALEPVELPVFLQPPTDVILTGDRPGLRLDQMIVNWSEALVGWFTLAPPSGADGTLHFDLSILTNLTAQPMPLLRLRNLRLSIGDVIPPLPTQ